MKYIATNLFISVILCASGCNQHSAEPPGNQSAAATRPAATKPASTENTNVVDIIAKGMQFSAPDTIPSGWVTFRFHNQSSYTHFALLERWPEGHTLADGEKQIAPVFQDAMDLLIKGDKDAAMKRFGDLPGWMKQIVYIGGPGLIAPGGETSATVKLDPGYYIIECYVKTDGRFHSSLTKSGTQGMTHEFKVTATDSGGKAPDADIQIQISSDKGIQADGRMTPGRHTVSVHFVDQKAYGNFTGHDVHLVELGTDTDRAGLMQWMNWMNPDGLSTPAPVVFVGGLNEMPAGNTGYFTVNLEPGNYAWISEIPDPDQHGMFRPFSVGSSTEKM